MYTEKKHEIGRENNRKSYESNKYYRVRKRGLACVLSTDRAPSGPETSCRDCV